MIRTICTSVMMVLAMALLTVGCGNATPDQNLRQQNVDGSFDRALNQQQNNGMINDDLGITGNGNRQLHNGYPGHNRQMNNAGGQRDEFEIAEEAAEKVAGLDGVRSAYVLKTDDNAFVAAVLDNGGKLSRRMEDQVAQAVRSIDGSVKNVYVSTNPSFIDRVDGYIDDVRSGRPVEGFFEEFSEIVDRIFPNAR